MPVLYLGHGAPPLLDDELWTGQLAAWAATLPRPRAVLIVSAHWESAPLTLGATETGTPLTYDFYGFPERFYRLTYPSPGAPDLAARIAGDDARHRDRRPRARRTASTTARSCR